MSDLKVNEIKGLAPRDQLVEKIKNVLNETGLSHNCGCCASNPETEDAELVYDKCFAPLNILDFLEASVCEDCGGVGTYKGYNGIYRNPEHDVCNICLGRGAIIRVKEGK